MATKVAERAKPRRRIARESALDTPDPIEIAMTAAASGKPLPDVARSVLEAQANLIRAQCAELRLRNVGERVRAVLWAVLAVAAAAILALIVAVVLQASRADALVVQSFRVPPVLEARGLTGEVVATQVLDKLAEMQEQSESTRAASSYANNWEDELKIDIPNTGASADQVWKLLRGWLGKETRISGEVIEAGGGLALTARVSGKPGQRFASPMGDLDALVVQGADLIYRNTQPYRHAVFLGNDPKRADEREALLKRLTADPSAMERKWAFNGLSVDHRERGDFKGAIAMAQRALAIDPKMIPSMNNVASAHGLLGHDQALVDTYGRVDRMPVGKEFDPIVIEGNKCLRERSVASASGDPSGLDGAVACMEASTGTFSLGASATRVDADLMRNDPRSALLFQPPASPQVTPAEAALGLATYRLRGELLRGSTPALAQALDAYLLARRKAVAEATFPGYYRAAGPTQSWPLAARALSLLGRHAEASALVARTPLDCYACLRARGVVAKASGNAPAAQTWFLEAVRQGPRLAPAYADWGRLLADNRRFASAEVRFEQAVRLAPNWGEPLKYWGDALAAQGKHQAALDKYDAALKRSPNWLALRQARAKIAG
jgi:tetratricopeptide (TPR) repeat protein